MSTLLIHKVFKNTCWRKCVIEGSDDDWLEAEVSRTMEHPPIYISPSFASAPLHSNHPVSLRLLRIACWLRAETLKPTCSNLHPTLLTKRPWASYIISLCFSFLIYKVGHNKTYLIKSLCWLINFHMKTTLNSILHVIIGICIKYSYYLN